MQLKNAFLTGASFYHSLEKRAVLLIFSLEIEISGVVVQSIHQSRKKWQFLQRTARIGSFQKAKFQNENITWLNKTLSCHLYFARVISKNRLFNVEIIAI